MIYVSDSSSRISMYVTQFVKTLYNMDRLAAAIFVSTNYYLKSRCISLKGDRRQNATRIRYEHYER
jgi:hypothetical protein